MTTTTTCRFVLATGLTTGMPVFLAPVELCTIADAAMVSTDLWERSLA